MPSTISSSFDSSGLSAVRNFFGKASSSTNTAGSNDSNRHHDKAVDDVPLATKRVSTSSKSVRRGVGASKEQQQQSMLDDTPLASKVIMTMVGRRKRNEQDEEDDFSDNPSNEDDEEGRTAIDDTHEEKQQGVRNGGVPNPETTDTKGSALGVAKSKTKKKGKKERQRHDETAAGEASSGNNVSEASASASTVIETTSAPLDASPLQEDPASSSSSWKRKRRKVRSRQKNIYKDKRPMDQKPEHLVPGNREFGGRPLTAETREKLSLPPPKERKRPLVQRNNVENEGGGLAIDELLSDEYDHAEEPKKLLKTKMLRKRPKYKNFRV